MRGHLLTPSRLDELYFINQGLVLFLKQCHLLSLRIQLRDLLVQRVYVVLQLHVLVLVLRRLLLLEGELFLELPVPLRDVLVVLQQLVHLRVQLVLGGAHLVQTRFRQLQLSFKLGGRLEELSGIGSQVLVLDVLAVDVLLVPLALECALLLQSFDQCLLLLLHRPQQL